jgi:hypothetical protein
MTRRGAVLPCHLLVLDAAHPTAADFGGEGRIPKAITQTAWLNQMKNNGCVGCHQLGQRATRTIPEAFGKFPNSAAAWLRRTSSGQSGMQMTQQLLSLGPLGAQLLGDWTDRIAKGELPRTKPQRPQGIERNVVVTLEGLGDDKHYLHDIISTDKRRPTVNAYGPLYGSPEYSTDNLPVLDPVKHTTTTFHATVLDPKMPLSLGPGHAAGITAMAPSAYWGRGADLGYARQQPQLDGGCKGARLARRINSRSREPGVLPAGFRSGRRRRCSPSRNRPVRLPCGIRSLASIRRSIRASRRTIRSLASTRTRRYGSAAVSTCSAGSTRRCTTRPATS